MLYIANMFKNVKKIQSTTVSSQCKQSNEELGIQYDDNNNDTLQVYILYTRVQTKEG